jgi:transcriptional regulator with XRE-family HTH domain
MQRNLKTALRRLAEAGYTQMEIERLTGLPQPQVSRWTKGGGPKYVDKALRIFELADKLPRN